VCGYATYDRKGYWLGSEIRNLVCADKFIATKLFTIEQDVLANWAEFVPWHLKMSKFEVRNCLLGRWELTVNNFTILKFF